MENLKDQPCYCHIHTETLKICPACVASAGGKATARKYGTKKLSEWGRKGGRPKKRVTKKGKAS